MMILIGSIAMFIIRAASTGKHKYQNILITGCKQFLWMLEVE